MDLLVYGLTFVFGSIIGSFLNVVIDQSNEGKFFENRRSYCDHCRHKLSTGDLIPILSFFMLNGKCRYCKKKISPYYPVVESITGFTFVFVMYYLFGELGFLQLGDLHNLLSVGYLFFIMSSLIVIFFVDLKYGIIPFSTVLGAVLLIFAWYFMMNINLVPYLLSGVGAFVFFFALFFITKGRGMGFGDVVYAFLMGLLLGYPDVVLSLYIAFIGGAVISIILVLLRKKRLKGSTIPFGPFLVMGTVVSLFWGEYLIEKILFFLVI